MRPPRPLTDREALVVALGAAFGALHPARASLLVGLVVAVVAMAGRRALLLPVAVALVASGLAQRSLDGLDGVQAGSVHGDVVLVGDPAPSPFGGLRVDVRVGGRRMEARAEGGAAGPLTDRLAGEVVRVRGEVIPIAEDDEWLRSRHVSGRLRLLTVEPVGDGNAIARLANGLRRTLVEGTPSLGARQRSLFTGLVLGDDRYQPADLADAFRGAGLTHVLAVSGQNVAFALAMAGPVLRRLRLWPRLGATLAVIALFGVMTRFEPSVLRASAMAALAAALAMAGRPVPRLRVIALAVTGLLLVDPLLVASVGFQLSVCAATAIVVVAPRLAEAMPGPRALRDALAVTLAAQVGVAPVLLATFGPIPVASLPANLLAVPVAGAVMVWGLTAGLAAGGLGGPAAAVLHGPTRLALRWLELVATRASAAPLGELGAVQVALLAVALALSAARIAGPARRLGWSLALAVGVTAIVSAHAPAPLRSSPAAGVVRWHGGGTEVVVLGEGAGHRPLGSAAALAALRRSGVQSIDLLVIADASVPEAVVEAVRRVHPAGAVLTHRRARSVGVGPSVGQVPVGATAVDVGGLRVRLVDAGERLVVEAVPRAP